jgi:hypothetical protein
MGGPIPPFGQELLQIASQLIQPRLLPGEDSDGFLSGATFLATERAQVHDRAPISLDLLFVIYIFGLCPWQRDPSPDVRDRLGPFRQDLFARAAAAGDPMIIRNAVPAATLLLPVESVDILLARHEVRDFLRI